MKTMINKISVITPSIRNEGLKIVQKALEEQEFVDFDWYVCSPEKPQGLWCEWMKDDFKGGYWTLNRAYNRLLKCSEGELVVSWQDYTYGDNHILDVLWKRYKEDKKGLVSIPGHKYLDDEFSFETWFDPRLPSGFRQCAFNEVEWNLCSCPRKGLEQVGGFIEKMDYLGMGMDGYSVNEKLNEKGYNFYIEPNVRTYSIMHGRVDNWDENNLMWNWEKTKEKLKQDGFWHKDYLS